MEMTKSQFRIVLDRRCDGASSYIVTAGDEAFDVTVISKPWKSQPVLKDWLRRIHGLYLNQRNRKACVGIGASKHHNSGGAHGLMKGGYYQMLEICVGDYCLLIQMEPYGAAHTTVKNFFKQFFTDDSFVFVGDGFKDVLTKIHDQYEDTDFKGLLNITKVIDLRELAYHKKLLGDLRCSTRGLKLLVKLVLNVEYDIPNKRMRSCKYAEGGAGGDSYEFSDEQVLWSSVEVFLVAKMGMKMLKM